METLLVQAVLVVTGVGVFVFMVKEASVASDYYWDIKPHAGVASLTFAKRHIGTVRRDSEGAWRIEKDTSGRSFASAEDGLRELEWQHERALVGQP